MVTTPEQIQEFKNRNQTMLRAGFGTTIATTAAVRNPYINATPTTSNEPPAKAPAAPKGNTKEVFTGLAEALNSHQQKLVKQFPGYVADIYEFEFAEGIGSATLKRQGGTDYSAVAMQDKKTAKLALDANTNSMNTNSRSIQVTAGMQIVQFIDQTIRNSSYITEQQLYIYDKDNKQIPNPAVSGKQVAWFKINVQATQLAYDEYRRDNAYKMKFLITPYAINAVSSEYFSKSRYRGSHKKYYYWFTGQNTQILNFEQDINYAFRLAVTGTGKLGGNNTPQNDFRGGGDQIRRTYMATSENHAKGAEGYINEPGDNLAEILYNPTDFKSIKLKIVGDPAWLQQGEITTGVSAKNFNYSAFNDDGAINYDSQEVVFDVSWNRPADYDFNTGLMDVTAKNTKNNEAQENNTYKATLVKSTFSKGRFEQEITGQAFVEYSTTPEGSAAAQAANNGRPAASSTDGAGPVYGDSRSSSTLSPATGDWAAEVARTQREDLGTATEQNENDSAPQPQPAPAAEPATSNGDISGYGEQNEAEVAGISDNPANQYMDREA